MARKLLVTLILASLVILPLRAEPTVSLDLQDVELRVVLEKMAEQLNLKLVCLAGTSSHVTVHWDNEPLSSALLLLKVMTGVSCQVSGQELVATVPESHEMVRVEVNGQTIDTTSFTGEPDLTVPLSSGGLTPGVVPTASPMADSGVVTFSTIGVGYAGGGNGETRPGIGGPTEESYAPGTPQGFLTPDQHPLSTFSIDVDTASYSNLRRFLSRGEAVPPEAVRLEEMVNYFSYSYPEPKKGEPFSVTTELAACPWAPGHQLLSVALQARRMTERRQPCNLVFLVDVSGSMSDPNKLPLLKRSLMTLVDTLRDQDRVALVTYAGESRLALDATSDKHALRQALAGLEAEGSTNGASGIQRAYEVARQNVRLGGVNRVILCTDGDFNVGVSDNEELVRLIERERKSGVYLSVLGFGMGNLKDDKLELLADRGNGSYAYIDTLFEARRVLVEQGGGTLQPVAQDVKLQVEFNPSQVEAYRLLGYENRRLADEDFQNDAKDAGELGEGQSVTALYEVVPHGQPIPGRGDLHFKPVATRGNGQSELAYVQIRYKEPQGSSSKPLELAVGPAASSFGQASENLRFAASVAGFGMLLEGSEFKGELSYASVVGWARQALGEDREGYRREFLKLVEAQASDSSAQGELERYRPLP